MAAVWACKRFRGYVIGNEFKLITDAKALKWMKEASGPSKLLRWAIELQEFDYQFENRAGIDNGNADALSRGHIPVDDELDEEETILALELLDNEVDSLFDAQMWKHEIMNLRDLKIDLLSVEYEFPSKLQHSDTGGDGSGLGM